MSNDTFIEFAKKIVKDYVNDILEITDNKEITLDDVYIVWICKALQNNKALLSTTLSDGMYYEVTYNGNTKEIYLDAYKKWQNKAYIFLDDKEVVAYH